MEYLIESQAGGNRALAFGLTWQTTLGNEPDAVAAKLAAKQKATAYTRGGSRSTVVGLLKTKRRAEWPKTEVYSAAAVFARAFPRQAVAVRLKVKNGVWLAAAYDGVVVIGTDVIHPTPEAAQDHLLKLKGQYRNLMVYGDQANDQLLPANLLVNQLDASTRLKRTTLTYAQVPAIAWAAVGLIAAWLVLDYGYSWYREYQQAHVDVLRAQANVVDPSKAWEEAIQAWANQTPDHSGSTLPKLLHEIGEVPLTAGRWELVEVDCSPIGWRCAARYRREHLGTNKALRESLPADWDLSFPDLNNAITSWAISSKPNIMERSGWLESLYTNQDLTVAWASTLQRLAPALADATLGEPSSVSIVSPTQTDSGGVMSNVPLPSGLSLPTTRDLVINGPMRSLYLLKLPPGAFVERIQVRRLPASKVGIDTSSLVATLTGKLHAK